MWQMMLYMYTLDRVTDVALVGGGVYPQQGVGFLICHERDAHANGEGVGVNFSKYVSMTY